MNDTAHGSDEWTQFRNAQDKMKKWTRKLKTQASFFATKKISFKTFFRFLNILKYCMQNF